MKDNVKITFVDQPCVELIGDDDGSDYRVIFYDNANNVELIYESTIKRGYWTKVNKKHYVEWKIVILKDGEEYYEEYFDCRKKDVIINTASVALGDNISWIPYCEEFRKKHDCNLTVFTKFGSLFKETYPNISFTDDYDIFKKDFYCSYEFHLGINYEVYTKGIKKLNKFYESNIPIKFIDNLTFFNRDYHTEHPMRIPMQKIASNILGLEYTEIRPNIVCDVIDRPIREKYICISEFASANIGMKVWNNKIGWQTIVNSLNNMGYTVVSISKEKSDLKNVVKRNGNYDLNDRVWYLKHCEFFIGLASGLSWLSWAVGKKTVMIGGFSEDWCEFVEDNIRVKNYDACSGCFNSVEHADKLCCYHASLCPENKNFECSRKISPKMVLNKIIENNLI